jgi:hypothetical protein
VLLLLGLSRFGFRKLEAVGKDAAMPWETDGRRWHLELRTSHGGKPCRCPISKSLASCAGVTLTTPVPNSRST